MITIEMLDEQIAGYKAQYDQLQAALVKLESDYAAQKDMIVATLNQVSGAAQALDVLKGQLTPAPTAVETTNEVLAATPESNDDVLAVL